MITKKIKFFKKNATFEGGEGFLNIEIFNFLFGKIFYDGQVWESEISGIDINDGELKNADIRNVFFNGVYDGINFINTNFLQVKFSNCKFHSIQFNLSIFRKCTFEKCFFLNCDFEGSNWSGEYDKIKEGNYTINTIKSCFSENCAYSTARGIGPTVFYTEYTNDRLITDMSTILWKGENIFHNFENPAMLGGR